MLCNTLGTGVTITYFVIYKYVRSLFIRLCPSLMLSESQEGFSTSNALPSSFFSIYFTVVQDTEMSVLICFSVVSALIPVKQYHYVTYVLKKKYYICDICCMLYVKGFVLYVMVSSEEGSISSGENYVMVILHCFFFNFLLTAEQDMVTYRKTGVWAKWFRRGGNRKQIEHVQGRNCCWGFWGFFGN